MPDIHHRPSIKAPPEHVREIVATKKGAGKWWTARPQA
jgi:hypothetical protein